MAVHLTRQQVQALADGPVINPIGHGRRPSDLWPKPRKTTQPRGYAMPPGTGPQGETCKTCRHYTHTESGSRRTFRKCGANAHNWTRGPGSDIKASSAACRVWAKREDAP